MAYTSRNYLPTPAQKSFTPLEEIGCLDCRSALSPRRSFSFRVPWASFPTVLDPAPSQLTRCRGKPNVIACWVPLHVWIQYDVALNAVSPSQMDEDVSYLAPNDLVAILFSGGQKCYHHLMVKPEIAHEDPGKSPVRIDFASATGDRDDPHGAQFQENSAELQLCNASSNVKERSEHEPRPQKSYSRCK